MMTYLQDWHSRWLGTGPRRYFGNVAEDVCTLVVDLSEGMAAGLSRLKLHIQELFATVLIHKSYFNVICFTCSDVEVYDRELRKYCSVSMPSQRVTVEVNDNNLQQAWEWICQWQCDDSREKMTMEAVDAAVADLRPQLRGAHGIYLVTNGTEARQNDVSAYVRRTLEETATKVTL